MDARTVFKLNVLSQLAQAGICPGDVREEHVKQAESGLAAWLGGRVGRVADVGTDTVKGILATGKNMGVMLGLPALAAGPFAIGALAGGAGAAATDIDRTDVKAEQTRELIQLHQDYLARLEAARRAARQR